MERLRREPYNRKEDVDVGYVSLILHRLERKGWLTVHPPPEPRGKGERGRPGPEYRCSVSLEELVVERALGAVRQVTLGDSRSLELFREALESGFEEAGGPTDSRRNPRQPKGRSTS